MTRSTTAAAAALAAAALAAGCSGTGGKTEAAAAGGGVLAAGLDAESLASGAAVGSAAGITVVGTSSVAATPDAAAWSFGVQTSADTAAAALAASSEAMGRVVAALRAAGVARADLRTDEVSVYPRTSDDGTSIVGYDASGTVGATARELDRAGELVDAAVAAGANEVYGPSLTVSDAEGAYAAAIDSAFADARARAQAIARNAGVTLGAPVAIVEGGAGGGGVPTFVRGAPEAAGADVTLEPGSQDVAATLIVTFAIA